MEEAKIVKMVAPKTPKNDQKIPIKWSSSIISYVFANLYVWTNLSTFRYFEVRRIVRNSYQSFSFDLFVKPFFVWKTRFKQNKVKVGPMLTCFKLYVGSYLLWALFKSVVFQYRKKKAKNWSENGLSENDSHPCVILDILSQKMSIRKAISGFKTLNGQIALRLVLWFIEIDFITLFVFYSFKFF